MNKISIIAISLMLVSLSSFLPITSLADSQTNKTTTSIELYTTNPSDSSNQNQDTVNCYLCDDGDWRLAGGGPYTAQSCQAASYSTDSNKPDRCVSSQKSTSTDKVTCYICDTSKPAGQQRRKFGNDNSWDSCNNVNGGEGNPSTDSKQSLCTQNIPAVCYVCDAGKWRLESGNGDCHDSSPPTCQIDNSDTFGGCKEGGAATGDICETDYSPTSFDILFSTNKKVAGIAVKKEGDNTIINSNNSQGQLVIKPCTVDSSDNQVKDIFLNLVVRKVNRNGDVSPIVYETKIPNCDTKNILESDLGDLNQVARLDITAGYISDSSSSYQSSAASVTITAQGAQNQKITADHSVKIYSFPAKISADDKNITITASSNYSSTNPSFTLTNNNKTSTNVVSNDDSIINCQNGSGNCLYRLLIPSPIGHYSIKFCDDSNQCDSLEFDGVSTQLNSNSNNNNPNNNTQPTGQANLIPLSGNSNLDHVNFSFLDEINMPLNGDKVSIDLSTKLNKDLLETVGFFKVYYKDGSAYDILPIKFVKKRIGSEEDGIGGCCEKEAKTYLQGCKSGESCIEGNGVCQSGFACSQN